MFMFLTVLILTGHRNTDRITETPKQDEALPCHFVSPYSCYGSRGQWLYKRTFIHNWQVKWNNAKSRPTVNVHSTHWEQKL